MVPAGLNDWHWAGDWPRLSQPFIARVAGHLQHRVVVTRGKL